jgi:lipopolysaccharide/colanic/teichoic acid biosynthesis glycosyltransferase
LTNGTLVDVVFLGVEIIAEYPHKHRVRPGMTRWAQIRGIVAQSRQSMRLGAVSSSVFSTLRTVDIP